MEIQPALDSQPQEQAISKPRDRRALSALRHGLTGQIHILTAADQAAFDKHCQGYRESFAPEGKAETDLVQAIAGDRWRLQRAAALEDSIFAEGISAPGAVTSGDAEIDAALAQGRVWVTQGNNLALLTLYESRIQRRCERNMAELRTLQSERIAALRQAVEHASLLLDLAASGDIPFDVETEFPTETLPAKFVFSTAQIAGVAAWHRRLTIARKLHVAPQKPRRMAA
jgi:hypothetical protein